MTAPQAPAADVAERKAAAAPVTEVPEPGPVSDLASLSGVGARAPIAGAGGGHLDPRRVMSLQRAAGNGAVVQMLQRAPAPGAPPAKPLPKYKGRPKGTPVDEVPLDSPYTITDAIDKMPALMQNLETVIDRNIERMINKRYKPELSSSGFAAALIWARDAIFFFDSTGTLFSVESNLKEGKETDKPGSLPEPRFRLPNEKMILVSDPGTNRTWRVFARLGKSETKADVEEDEEEETVIGLNLHRSDNKPYLPGKLPAGGLVLTIYKPASLASREEIPQAGWKAEEGLPKRVPPSGPPRWASKQYELALKALQEDAAAKGLVPDETGTGAGIRGEGEGGGGVGVGIGTGRSGSGIGAADKDEGKGRGRITTPPDPKKPDKVVLWMRGKQPMVKVQKNGQAESIPLKANEEVGDLKKRIQEASARQQSTGETLAGAQPGTLIGGEGGAKATLQDILDATKFTANAAAYPSKLDMLGGSGADVSPNGWATTVRGGKHDFSMILDYAARQKGLVNETFARLGFISYFWQVIDISGMDASGNLRPKGEFESQKDFENDMRRKGWVANMQGRSRQVGRMEGIKEAVSDVASNKWEDAKEDLWRSKAQGVGLVALDAAWSIGKALVSAWVEEITKPENRRSIAFGDSGEFLVRCLANPHPNKDKSYAEQTRRATSIAVFPVRVVDIKSRAQEIVREDTKALNQSRALIAGLEEQANKDPKNESIQAALRIARRDGGQLELKYNYSTVQKIAAEVADYDKQLVVLDKLSDSKKQLQPADLPGEEKEVGFQLKDEIQKRRGRDSRAFVAWWDYEYHIHDVKEARKKKAEQKEMADKKAAAIKEGSAIHPRPRVSFVSEENGALVRMDMILGRSKFVFGGGTKWTLADVTTEKTARTYDGFSAKDGDEGDVEAVKNAFQAFCDKAEYGRGTIAVELPGNEKLVASGTTMLMKPGEAQRWRARLQSLVEIAGLVAPYVKGGQLIGKLVAVAGALDAAERLYDRATNDQLKANFETLTDVLAVLAPMAHGAASLAEKLPSTSRGAFVLSTAAKGIGVANEFLMPATFVHDLDKILRDPALSGPDREAAIVMLFGRGLRDGIVQYVKVKGPERVGGEPLAKVPDEAPPPTSGAVKPEATGRPAPEQVPGRTAPEQVPGRPGPEQAPAKESVTPKPGEGPLTQDVHRQTVKDKDAHTQRPKPNESEAPKAARPETVLETGVPGKTSPAKSARSEGPDTRRPGEYDTETMRNEARPDANARARAADYVPMYNNWQSLGVQGRKAHIEGIVNGYLAREGIPPVKIKWEPLPAGDAYFDHSSWTISLSVESVNTARTDARPFANFVDSAVHETQHTVTTFRGLRVALETGVFNPDVFVPNKIVGEALGANQKKPASREYDDVTRGEALEIYKTQIEPPIVGPAQKGAVNREAVLTRLDEATKAMTNADKVNREAQAELAQNPRDPHALQHANETQAAYEAARAEHRAAHNDYASGTEEIASWRRGLGAGEAVMQQLTAQRTKADARDEAAAARKDEDRARGRNDVVGVRKARQKKREAEQREREADARLDDLKPATEPQLVGGNVVKRGMALSQRDIAKAPKAPKEGYLQPGEEQRRSEGIERPLESRSSPARSQKVPAEPDRNAVPDIDPVAEDQSKWRGRDVGSDVAGRTVTPARGTGVIYEARPADRYQERGKPPGGTTDSVIMYDTVLKKEVLFKPETGEKVVDYAEARGVVKGEYAPRSKAAEVTVGRMAGEKLPGIETPPVELVNIGGKRGSVTDWVGPPTSGGGKTMSLQKYLYPTELTTPDVANQRFWELQKDRNFREAWNNVQALDYLINNLDRVQNFGNYLIEVGPQGEFKKLIPIDSELSFTATSERAVIFRKTEFLEKIQLSEPMIDKLIDMQGKAGEFRAEIEPLVGKEAADGVMKRLDDMVTEGKRQRAERERNRAQATAPITVKGPSAETPVGD